MHNEFFLALETQPADKPVALNEVIERIPFNEHGLIPVIAQDADSKRVLMLAWMNLAALEKTISSGLMTYWSRSRQDFWCKGETSGNTQSVVSMHLDCDGDTLLCQVRQTGGACHTGRTSCFYLTIDAQRSLVWQTGDYPNQTDKQTEL